MKEVTLSMTQEQINRYHTIMSSLEGKMTVAETAAALGLRGLYGGLTTQISEVIHGVSKETSNETSKETLSQRFKL